MVLDRTLHLDLLDAALRVASGVDVAGDAHPLLTVALRDLVSRQEAAGKTKDVLSRVWVSPRPASAQMIRWAIVNQDLDPGKVTLHFGALLAAFPFVGVVASVVGRQLHLHDEVDFKSVRATTASILGDRSTIDRGTSSVLTTMRRLGLLDGGRGRPAVARRANVEPELFGWLAHALLLTRQVEEIGVAEVARAPELSLLRIEGSEIGSYPLLETFSEGNRTIAVPRSVVPG